MFTEITATLSSVASSLDAPRTSAVRMCKSTDGQCCRKKLQCSTTTFFSSLLVQVVLHFTAPVSVDTTSGSPTLLLRVDPTTADAVGWRSADYIPGLTQFVDVGVDASR